MILWTGPGARRSDLVDSLEIVELAGRYSNPSDQVETVKMLAAQALKREEPRREAEGLPLGGGR